MTTHLLAPISWERMIRSVEKVRERLHRATAALETAGIPYAVAGGNAVAAWVSRVDEAAVRTTRDVDILLRRTDLDSARTALSEAGFIYRRVSGLGMPGSLDIFLDGENASARDAIHIIPANEKLRVDYALPTPDVTAAEHDGPFKVISLEGLVCMKLTSFRDKDRTHLRDMIEIGLIDSGWLERIPEVVRPRLAELLNTPEG